VILPKVTGDRHARADDQLAVAAFAGSGSSARGLRGRQAPPLPTPSVPPVAAACRRPGATLSRRAAWPMRTRPVLQLQELTGRPPRARHPVAAQGHGQGHSLGSRPTGGATRQP
jgi:hypothetical protein